MAGENMAARSNRVLDFDKKQMTAVAELWSP